MPEPTCHKPLHHRRACDGPAVAVRIIRRGRVNGETVLCAAHQGEYREDGYGIELASAPVHDLKLDARWFDAVASGAKPFEVRRDDRGFAVGDVLVLREWERQFAVATLPPPGEKDGYTARTIRRTVTYILRHEDYEGIAPGYCVLGLRSEGVNE